MACVWQGGLCVCNGVGGFKNVWDGWMCVLGGLPACLNVLQHCGLLLAALWFAGQPKEFTA